MAKKQNKPVEQNETEQDSTAVEKSKGKQKELVKAPSSSPTASAAADPDSIPEKIVSVAEIKKKNKNAETSSAAAVTSRKTKKKNKNAETSSAAAVTSRKTKKKNKKLPIQEEGSLRDLSPEEKPTKKPVEHDEEKEEPKDTHEQENLVFQTPTHSPAASLAIAETETQEKEESTDSKKRPLEEASPSSDVDTKRVKTGENTNSNFKRVWSEEDEIVLLQEIKTFGSIPVQLKAKKIFRKSLKPKISFEFSLSQLALKMEKLKQKFRDEVKKEVVDFKTPHDKKRFELSKEIWGSIVEEEEKMKNMAMKTHRCEGWFEKSFLLGSVASFGLGEKGVKEGWSLVSAERKDKIKAELRLSVAEEIKSMMRKSRLVSEVMSAIAEATS
ncbi:unnamed protein product [Microthlaspi erraticum]|uniref:Uncharacterized protein n=1 Tax=Microthlaspi erraticum TaxID=1685480 RepID=A0A6D2K4D8_9BRAS|nr:unnamed protein product [Microthlaspi erraticum]